MNSRIVERIVEKIEDTKRQLPKEDFEKLMVKINVELVLAGCEEPLDDSSLSLEAEAKDLA